MDSNTPDNQQPVSLPSVTTTQPMTHPGLPPQSTVSSAPSQKNGSKKWIIIAAVIMLLILLGGGIYVFAIINK